ncbi:MAG TPA: cytochrome P450, partial [Caulobacteraceae bacterium]
MNIAVKPEGVRESDAYVLPLAELNPARTDRFQDDTIWPVFERLRCEDPVHFTADSEFGPYWSIARWDDIMAVDTDHEAFSSTEGIGLQTLESRKA